MRHGPTNVAQDGTERRASPRPTGPHAVTHPLPHVSLSSHTHTYQHKHHTHRKFLLVPLFPPPLHIHTQGNGISCRDVIFVSLSLDHSHFSCYLSHAPPVGPSIHASLEYVIHTHTSLGPAKCINYTFTHVTSRTPLI